METKEDDDENRNLSKLLELEGYIQSDFALYHQSKRHKLWMKLISSGWFSYFLQYLNLKDIAKLDSAFCNHEDRLHWLILVRKHSVPCMKIEHSQHIVTLVDWLILKNIHSNELKFNFISKNDKFPELSDEAVIQLINKCTSLKLFEINAAKRSFTKLFSHTIDCYRNLEVLTLYKIEISETYFEVLSNSCHQLKVIELININATGIEKLLMTNRNLVEFNLQNNDKMGLGNIFDVFGQYCSLLEKCSLIWCKLEHDVTNVQVETFIKRCRNLKCLKLTLTKLGPTIIPLFDRILLFLGTYNSMIDDLELICYYSDFVMRCITTESMRIFSMGCSVLTKLEISNINLPTQGINHLINYATQLEKLTFQSCDICDDGFIITKDNNKLKHLKILNVSHNVNINDESFINIINGCYNLEHIVISKCDELTDASLFNIAANCPNLKELYVNKYNNTNFTDFGLEELKAECIHLDTNDWPDDDRENNYDEDDYGDYYFNDDNDNESNDDYSYY